MKTFICSICESAFKISKKEAKVAEVATIQFCSVGCFRDVLMGMAGGAAFAAKAISLGDTMQECESLPMVDCKTMAYSPKLGVTFRSDFERVVAETLSKWNIPFLYEQVVMTGLGIIYIPDFYLYQNNNIYLEVKGYWEMGAKKKFNRAVEVYGAGRMLLVPPHLFKSFKREVGTH